MKRLGTTATVILFAVCAIAVGAEWTVRYDGGNGYDGATALALSPSGQVYAAGYQAGSDGSEDLIVIRYEAANGDMVIGTYRYLEDDAGFSDGAEALAVSDLGNIYVTGYSTDTVIDDEDTYYFQQVTTLKFNADLGLQWATYVPPGNRSAKLEEPDPTGNAVVTRDDTAYVAAEAYYTVAKSFDVLAAKHWPDGDSGWEKSVDGNHLDDGGLAVAVDPLGNAYVAGFCYYSGQGQNYVTLKYDADGHELWSQSYNGPADGSDAARALLVDADGNVYVTGQSAGDGTGADYATVKYDSIGDEVWVARYNGPGNSTDAACAMAFDDAGYLYVTGVSMGSGTGKDFLTIKYDPDSGETLWTRRYHGSGSGDDEALALTVDAENAVYVAGYTTVDDKDYRVIKYSSDGAELNTWTYDSIGDDIATGIAVDADRNVYVTGRSAGASDDDIVTCKFEQVFGSDYAVLSIDKPADVAEYGTAVNPTVKLWASETSDSATFDVVFRIGDFYEDTQGVTIGPGEVRMLSFVTWDVREPGTHLAACTLRVPDDNPANNKKTKWVRVLDGWRELRSMPLGGGKKVKRGGWLAFNPGDSLIYATKGYKTDEFYVYDPGADTWGGLARVLPGREGKMPQKGCKGICDGDDRIFMTKGYNTLGYWLYSISGDSWVQLADVPLGLSGKKVKGGTDLVFVTIGDTGYVYMLKGYKTDFFRFNTVSQVWDSTLSPAPIGIKYKWDKGSWIVYDGKHTIYAHKAKYYSRQVEPYAHEMWKYDIPGDTWYNATPLKGMPLYGLHNGKIRKKKSKDGGAGAWLDGNILAIKGGSTQQFWKYYPDGDTWQEQDTVPSNGSTNKKKRVKYGGDIVNANGVLYALKGNKTLEFWRYIPGGGGFSGGGYAARPARPRRRTGRRAGLTPFVIPGRMRPGLRSALSAGQSVSLPGLVRAPGQDAPKRPGEGPRTDVDTVFDVLTEFAPAWSPDGQWLAYSRYDPEFGWDRLFQYNPWTGEEFPIEQPDAHCNRPAWSPSGDWVAYEVDGFGTTGFTQIWRSCVTGTISEVSPMTCEPFDHFNVQFSPCGMYLVYEADLPDFSQIFMVPFKAPFVELPITREPRDHYNPRPYWSALSTVPPGRGGIGPGPATSWDVVYEREDDYFTQICWTPDGATAPFREPVEEFQLTFREVDHTNPCPPNCSTDVIFQAEDDEFGMEQIWKVRLWEPGAEELLVLDEDADFGHPDMSPDGGMVACDRDLYDGSIVIYGIDLYGRMSGELTDPNAIRTWPKFSPGGEAIAVCWELMAGEGGGVLSSGTVPGQDYRFRQVTANPSVGNIGVRWQMPYPGHVRIAVYDKVGRLVKLMRDEEASAGSGHAVWDRTDRYGRKVATGVYFCDFRAGEYRSRKKFVLMK